MSLTRRIKRFLKKRKSSKLHKEIMEFQKYSLICFIADPQLPLQVNDEEDLRQIFIWCVQQAGAVLSKVFRLIIKFLKKGSVVIFKFLMRGRWMVAFATYTVCALLILQHLSKKFRRKLCWYERLLLVLLFLGIASLLAFAIQNEAFSTIIQWLKSILLTILFILRRINSSLAKWLKDYPSDSSSIGDKPQVSETSNDFKNFVLFSILTFVVTKYMLIIYKRRLVGEGPFTDIIIEMIDNYTPPGHQKRGAKS